ncbi:MAG TPA: exodeoxyribonuclease VII small subunit [Lentisphaeria bacterium]|nr:MAG: exodeoxyribonuclease VII small subunit [Lentisphaerae bacterium GWF2_50_93]HCE45396.1 exodeoxyribonuclease VII small subunit [Lentisphaeria bacterium]
MKKDGKLKEVEALPFEKALERLEAVIEKMESGKLQLDEMMKYFEEGSALSALCEKKLKELEKKIEILVKNEQGGKWKEFQSEPEENAKDSSDDNQDDLKDSLL